MQAEILKVEALFSAKEAEIETAIGDGNSTDKLFEAAGIMKGKASAMSSVLEKMQSELEAALARETRQAELKQVDRIEATAQALFKKLSSDQVQLIQAARALVEKVQQFNETAAQLARVGGNRFSAFHDLLTPKAESVLQACAFGNSEFHNLDQDMQKAADEIESLTRSCRSGIESHLLAARSVLSDED